MSDGGLAAAIAEGGAGEGGGAGGAGGAGGEGGDAAAVAAAAAAAKAGGGEGGGDAWYATLPDEAAEGALSDRKWAENKKYADIPSLVKAHRSLEQQFLGGDKIVVPKEGASPEEIAAFHAKLGRPDAPDKYEIAVSEGAKLDEALVAKFRETAFKAGLPASMAAPLVEMFNGHVQETLEAAEAARAQASQEGVKAMRKEWGASAPQNLAAANRAMTMLGLSGADVEAMGDALPPEQDDQGNVKRNGAARALALLAKLGVGMGEDVLSGGGGVKKFGMSPSEAQAKLDAIAADPAQMKKLNDKDPQITAYRKQLIEIVAAGEDAQAQKG
jgi:hypothetical protein